MSTELYIPEIADELGVIDYSRLKLQSPQLCPLVLSAASDSEIQNLVQLMNLADEDFTSFIKSEWNNFWPNNLSTKVDLFTFLLSNNEPQYRRYKSAAVYLLSSYFTNQDTLESHSEFAVQVIQNVSSRMEWGIRQSIDWYLNTLKRTDIDNSIRNTMAIQIMESLVSYAYWSTRIPQLLKYYIDSVSGRINLLKSPQNPLEIISNFPLTEPSIA